MGTGDAPAFTRPPHRCSLFFGRASPDPLQHPRRSDGVLEARAPNRTGLADGLSGVIGPARHREPRIGAGAAARCLTLPLWAMRQQRQVGTFFRVRPRRVFGVRVLVDHRTDDINQGATRGGAATRNRRSQTWWACRAGSVVRTVRIGVRRDESPHGSRSWVTTTVRGLRDKPRP